MAVLEVVAWRGRRGSEEVGTPRRGVDATARPCAETADSQGTDTCEARRDRWASSRLAACACNWACSRRSASNSEDVASNAEASRRCSFISVGVTATDPLADAPHDDVPPIAGVAIVQKVSGVRGPANAPVGLGLAARPGLGCGLGLADGPIGECSARAESPQAKEGAACLAAAASASAAAAVAALN